MFTSDAPFPCKVCPNSDHTIFTFKAPSRVRSKDFRKRSEQREGERGSEKESARERESERERERKGGWLREGARESATASSAAQRPRSSHVVCCLACQMHRAPHNDSLIQQLFSVSGLLRSPSHVNTATCLASCQIRHAFLHDMFIRTLLYGLKGGTAIFKHPVLDPTLSDNMS